MAHVLRCKRYSEIAAYYIPFTECGLLFGAALSYALLHTAYAHSIISVEDISLPNYAWKKFRVFSSEAVVEKQFIDKGEAIY